MQPNASIILYDTEWSGIKKQEISHTPCIYTGQFVVNHGTDAGLCGEQRAASSVDMR